MTARLSHRRLLPWPAPHARTAGTALVSVVVAAGIMIILMLIVASGIKQLSQARATVDQEKSIADVEKYLPAAVWRGLNAVAKTDCGNAGTVLFSTGPNPPLNQAIGQYGQITWLDQTTAANVKAAVPAGSLEAAAAERCRTNQYIPGAAAAGNYYFCVQLLRQGAPPKSSFFQSMAAAGGTPSAFAEVHVALRHPSDVAGASISCNNFRDNTGGTGVGVIHYTVYWRKSIHGSTMYRHLDSYYIADQLL
jgi:hypothetical protein